MERKSKLDKKRILSKIDELDSYLYELEQVIPATFEDYTKSIKNKRSCERLLQISIEVVIDICNIIISNFDLGIPSDDEDIFRAIVDKKILSKKVGNTLSDMKGFRNILVHKYGVVNDEVVFEVISNRLDDFETFKEEVLKVLNT
ncbi:MAG: DUF86 domain-containing protein [Candidatus Pacearchaeota archaeon]